MALGTAATAYAIKNGQPDGDNHPYVGILVFDLDGVGPAWRCSGALISPTVILTAGHCTNRAIAARVWFQEKVTDEYSNPLVPDYPDGGVVAVEGTPYTHPDFCIGCGKGLPGFALRDVGVVVLDDPVVMDSYALLPDEGLVDTLRVMTDVDFVGYGVQELPRGGGPPNWIGTLVRLFARSKLISGKFVHSDEFLRLTLNPGQGKGGTCFGDSGGPDLLGGTDIILGVNSYVTNYNCAGVGYSSRVDILEVLEWINSFPSP